MSETPRVALLQKLYGDHYPGVHRFVRERETADPYLELLRLLSEAAGIEHSLMLAYLFAMFSIKERYHQVRGDLTLSLFMDDRTSGQPTIPGQQGDHSYLELCTQEMQHLGLVNGLLGELGGAPNLMPHQFPLPADIYPFEIDLESLSRSIVAKYLWIEADNVALDPAQHQGHKDELKFIEAVLALLPVKDRPTHVGSIYRRILHRFKETRDKELLPADFPYNAWHDRLRALQFQGEITHYMFFKGQFTGKAFGGDASVWEPGPQYPANRLIRGTAFPDYPDTIRNGDAREVAKLANLHYWILLMLLDVSYRGQDRGPRYKAIDSMTQCLWHLGLWLARRWGVGLPFDQLGRNYGVGRDRSLSLHIIRRYATEAIGLMGDLDERGLLPDQYDRSVLQRLERSIQPKGDKDVAQFEPVFE
jgi:Ferritin-like